MKKILLLSILLLLAGCGDVEYSIVEIEENSSEGGKSSARIIMEEPTEEEIKEIVRDIYNEDGIWGSASLHVWIHEASENDEFGGMIAQAKYARGNEGLPQVGVDEIDTVYIEWE